LNRRRKKTDGTKEGMYKRRSGMKKAYEQP